MEETEQVLDKLQIEDEEESGDDETTTIMNPLYRGKSCLHAIVDRLQRIRLWRSGQERIKLIEGLDEVVFGTLAAADAVTICGLRPPRYAFFVLSGASCDVVQLILDMGLHFWIGIEQAMICWFGGFFLSIVVRHTFHRYLVFGAHVGGYFGSLLRMYLGYSISLILSTVFDYVMVDMMDLPHYVAWAVTLLWTGAFNYFMLKRCWKIGGAPVKAKDCNDESEMVPLPILSESDADLTV
jgi:hypothetical protein